MSEEKIGFHKGAMQTLIGEKTELMKMINTVDQLILAHNNALKELGIDYLEELKKVQGEQQKQQPPSSSETAPPETAMPETQVPETPKPRQTEEDFDYEEPERLP